MLLKPLTAPLHCSAESLQPDSDSAHTRQSNQLCHHLHPSLSYTSVLFVQVCHFSLTSELPWLPGSAWWLGEDESLENRDVDLRPVYTLPKKQKALSLTHSRTHTFKVPVQYWGGRVGRQWGGGEGESSCLVGAGVGVVWPRRALWKAHLLIQAAQTTQKQQVKDI